LADSYHESKIVTLSGAANGVNKTFHTPTAYVTGTLRVVHDGLVYEPDDDKWGWTEIDNTTIEFTEAPWTDDRIQAFYQESSAIPSIDNVQGSPFHPTDALP